MADLNQVNGTFANYVATNTKRLASIQNDRSALMQFFSTALEAARAAGHFSEPDAIRFKLAVQQKRTAAQILKFIYDMSLSAAGMKVLK